MIQIARIAFRSLVRNKRRSALTMLAVALGVAVVIFAHGFGEGLLRVMVLGSVDTKLGALQIHKKGWQDANEANPLALDLAYDDELLARLEKIPHVTGVAPRLRAGAMLGNGTTSMLVQIEAVDPVREMQVCPARRAEVPEDSGSHVSNDASRGGVLGPELARALDAKLNDTLTIQAAGKEGQLNALDLQVRGITRGAMSLLEAKRVLIVPLVYAQELLQMNGKATEIAIAVDDIDNVHAVQAEIAKLLPPALEVNRWDEVMPFLHDATNRLRIVLRGVSAVLFFIVVFGVVNTMLMSVYERVREIGTMLAVGMRRAQVLGLFLLEAAVLGLLGGATGGAVGFAATIITNRVGISLTPPGGVFEQIIRPIPFVDIALLAIAVATVGAILAAAYPARKASLMDPVEALRTL